jgi:predicted metal-dependent hydrolase
MIMPEPYPELYLQGIKFFNEEEFFECHEVLEDLWSEVMGEEKKFLQGLIQAAVALFHFGNENLGGARKLYTTSTEKLAAYPANYMGMDIEKFLTDMEFCFQELLQATDKYPQGVVCEDERIPKIELAEQAE